MTDLDNLLDLGDAARELGLAPVTVRAAVANGRLNARKFGKTWITTQAEVDRYRAESLGKVGRPAVPILYLHLPWPDGAYGIKALQIGSLRGIDEPTREIVRAVASRAIHEGAWQLAEVIVKLQIDERLRGYDIHGDPRVPTLIVDAVPEPVEGVEGGDEPTTVPGTSC